MLFWGRFWSKSPLVVQKWVKNGSAGSKSAKLLEVFEKMTKLEALKNTFFTVSRGGIGVKVKKPLISVVFSQKWTIFEGFDPLKIASKQYKMGSNSFAFRVPPCVFGQKVVKSDPKNPIWGMVL